MKEARYATDKYALLHIVLSLLVMGAYLAYSFENESIRIGRSIMTFFVPAVCIWMPDTVAGLKDNLLSAKIIRIGGWFLLLLITLYPLLLIWFF